MYITNNIMAFRVPRSAFQLNDQKGTIILVIDVFLLYNPIYLRWVGLERGTCLPGTRAFILIDLTFLIYISLCFVVRSYRGFYGIVPYLNSLCLLSFYVLCVC